MHSIYLMLKATTRGKKFSEVSVMNEGTFTRIDVPKEELNEAIGIPNGTSGWLIRFSTVCMIISLLLILLFFKSSKINI